MSVNVTPGINYQNYYKLYVEHNKIASKSLKTIKKIQDCTKRSMENTGDLYKDREYKEYIFFRIPELCMILHSFTFAMLENFIEHIGFLLIENWDSDGKQRHLDKKLDALKKFIENINENFFSNKPDNLKHELDKEWKLIINDLKNLKDNNKAFRNSRNHVHTGKHDLKGGICDQKIHSDLINFSKETKKDTPYDANVDVCECFYKDVVSKMEKVHEFLTNNDLFRIVRNQNQTKPCIFNALNDFESNLFPGHHCAWEVPGEYELVLMSDNVEQNEPGKLYIKIEKNEIIYRTSEMEEIGTISTKDLEQYPESPGLSIPNTFAELVGMEQVILRITSMRGHTS